MYFIVYALSSDLITRLPEKIEVMPTERGIFWALATETPNAIQNKKGAWYLWLDNLTAPKLLAELLESR